MDATAILTAHRAGYGLFWLGSVTFYEEPARFERFGPFPTMEAAARNALLHHDTLQLLKPEPAPCATT